MKSVWKKSLPPCNACKLKGRSAGAAETQIPTADKGAKNLISQIEYELEQLERQYQQDMLDLEEWKKKANEERNTKINQLENERRKRAAELEGINNKLKT